MAVVVCAAALAIGAVLWTTSAVDARTKEAASLGNAATAASQIQAGMREPLTVMMLNAGSFILSNEGLSDLPGADRARVIDVVSSGFMGLEPGSAPLPDVSIPMSDRDAISLQRRVDLFTGQIDELVAGAGGIEMADVVQARDELRTSLESYFDENSATNFAAVFTDLAALGEQLDTAQDRLALGVTDAQAEVATATSRARIAMVVALLLLTALTAAATLYIGRLIGRAFRSSESEREELRHTTGSLQYRNDQLNALYAVFSEITDTLSMHYVISATLRETLRVMNAAMVVLRLLEDGQLVVVGNLTDKGKEIPDMLPVPLGEGPTGRVARRGRSMRLDEGAYAQLGPAPVEPNSGSVESGIIVPLIVGARVVGTLAVWSRETAKFTDEDERVLEMMASQVATAVVAADNAESSERRALHDPLTGLPNRRQLSEDIVNRYDRLEGDAIAAVAMIDIDKFKSVNDEFGHRVGDVSLQKVAAVLRNAMREGDMIYRYGGEEFVAVFKGVAGRDALVAAERLRSAVESTPITGDQLETVSPITISIGIAMKPEHGDDVNVLIERADRAMYRAKDRGRNRVEVWDEGLLAADLTTVA